MEEQSQSFPLKIDQSEQAVFDIPILKSWAPGRPKLLGPSFRFNCGFDSVASECSASDVSVLRLEISLKHPNHLKDYLSLKCDCWQSLASAFKGCLFYKTKSIKTKSLQRQRQLIVPTGYSQRSQSGHIKDCYSQLQLETKYDFSHLKSSSSDLIQTPKAAFRSSN
ncbi:hypothetical protein YC2023_045585 [Brassica napus]